MAGITLAEAEARLAAYLAAEEAVLTGQQYEINGRMLRRANLDQIQAGVTLWNDRVERLSARAAGRSVSITPRPIF
jgi:tRNA(Leu) C34 or U34 (ribose-2'-O)-methylase TrmL